VKESQPLLDTVRLQWSIHPDGLSTILSSSCNHNRTGTFRGFRGPSVPEIGSFLPSSPLFSSGWSKPRRSVIS